MARRILVVEDEPAMSRLLDQALTESGFTVTVADNGREGLALAADHDLLVVDVMMPQLNGFEMVRQMRSAGNRVPVLFLTAKDGPGDRVKGLDLGGDDYLVKPFRLDELLARIRALLRRTIEHQDLLRCDNLEIDVHARKARRGDHWLYLSNTEFALLQLLMTRQGETVSKETIYRELWNDDTPRDPNLVQVYINHLRSKLETMSMRRLIFTVHGRGYVLEAREEQS
jgi:two-component system copper resistance phosphate regulon response regulator CusR